MSHSMTSSALALLHNLQAAERGEQVPKHVAGELEEQGLAVQRGGSPGDIELTRAGMARLQGLLTEQSQSDGVQP